MIQLLPKIIGFYFRMLNILMIDVNFKLKNNEVKSFMVMELRHIIYRYANGLSELEDV